MALTTEQQAQVDVAIAIETSRVAQQAVADARRTKLEIVRLAKEVLVENRRNLPADQRQVTTADITSYADTLIVYVNA